MNPNALEKTTMPLHRRDFMALGVTALATARTSTLAAQATAPLMLQPTASSGLGASILATTGDSIGNYRPPGVMDGTAAWDWDENTVRLFVNHELGARSGYAFELDSGLALRGSRISWFDVDKNTRTVRAAGSAIRRIFDRRGNEVRNAAQISETDDPVAGLNTLCSAQGYRAGEMGFVDDILFTHEEVSAEEDHPHGGSIWLFDARAGELWALPELGRGSWENCTAIATPDSAQADGHVALLLADDLEFGAAPLYLWVGRKIPGADIRARNGLTEGQLYTWVPAEGHRNPEDWHGTGAVAGGTFVPLTARDPQQAGYSGHDRDGYLNDVLMREQARRAGAFMFSRPEDVHTNPANPRQVVLASAGHGTTFPSDDWGTVYRIDVEFGPHADSPVQATLEILHDADDYGDYGIRSADNVVWASDGMIYIQEDKATKLRPFGAQTKRNASVWQLNPSQPDEYRLMAVVDNSAKWPADARETKPDELGAWESSGILDVSAAFGARDELLLLATVQAHSVKGGSLGGQDDLVQASQLVLMSKPLLRG